MAQQIIDTETDHGTYKGDPAKVAFQKANDNFSELYAAGGSNLLINCGTPVNQRGFAGGTLAAGVYGYDRWKAGAGGCNVTINAGTGVFTHISGPLQQIVESPQLAWGKKLTISVEDPSGDVLVNVGGATGVITAGTGRRGVTLTPSGSGNMTVQLTATGATYSRPKLERGEAAGIYVPRDPATEFAICQWYWRRFHFENGSAFTAAVVLDPSTAIAWLTFPDMRQRPAASITGQLVMTGAGPVSAPATPTLLPASANNLAILLAVAGKTTGATGYLNPSAPWARIDLDAEL